MSESKSLEELLKSWDLNSGEEELWATQHGVELAREMARRLRKLAEWAAPDRHGHTTEKAAAEVRDLLEGYRGARTCMRCQLYRQRVRRRRMGIREREGACR